MSGYCYSCGAEVEDGANYCTSCGVCLTGSGAEAGYTDSSASTGSTAGSVLGTLATVYLLGGIARNLYYRNGMYYYDRFCRRPFPMWMIHRHPFMHGSGYSGRIFGGRGGFGGGRGGFGGGPGGFGGGHGGPGGFGGGHGGPGGFGGGRGGFGGRH